MGLTKKIKKKKKALILLFSLASIPSRLSIKAQKLYVNKLIFITVIRHLFPKQPLNLCLSLSICPCLERYGESASDQGRSQTGGSVRIPVAFIRQRDPVPPGKTMCLCE